MEKKEELCTVLYMLGYLQHWIETEDKIPQEFLLKFISRVIKLIEETIQCN